MTFEKNCFNKEYAQDEMDKLEESRIVEMTKLIQSWAWIKNGTLLIPRAVAERIGRIMNLLLATSAESDKEEKMNVFVSWIKSQYSNKDWDTFTQEDKDQILRKTESLGGSVKHLTRHMQRWWFLRISSYEELYAQVRKSFQDWVSKHDLMQSAFDNSEYCSKDFRY